MPLEAVPSEPGRLTQDGPRLDTRRPQKKAEAETGGQGSSSCTALGD